MNRLHFLLLPLLLLCLRQALAQDWPQFLGPTRNGSWHGPNLAQPRPGQDPLWKHPVGEGFSGPVVAGHHLILFHRINDREQIDCLNATNGQPIWTAGYPTGYRDDFGFDEGPRATPAVADGRVYTFGADGMLACWDLATGTARWRIDTHTKYNSDKGFFGRVCSPLVEGGMVLVNLGGERGAGIVAFDAGSGEERWRATEDDASYASPVAATLAQKRYAFVLTRSALVCLDPAAGTLLFDYPFRPPIQASVTAATPLVIDDLLFISASYVTGAALLQFDPKGPKLVWKKQDVLSNHYATAVHHQGFLYGYDGRQEQGCNLRCVELRSGQIRWTENRFGAGTLILANDTLLILTDKGELITAPATAEAFKPQQRLQILGFETRAHPALADGLFFARDKRQLICLDLRLR